MRLSGVPRACSFSVEDEPLSSLVLASLVEGEPFSLRDSPESRVLASSAEGEPFS